MRKFGYRAYLDGVRGISVLVVVLFHSGLPVFSNGFLGVDVFFVLSGYLITSIIICEIEPSRKMSLVGFYARRARRILPGATVTLLFVAVIYSITVNPYTVFENGMFFVAASTYWANFCFIASLTDYWADGKGTSPIKHYWSLSVEEQYYLVYPFVIWTIAFLLRLSSGFFQSLKDASKFIRFFLITLFVLLCFATTAGLAFTGYLIWSSASITICHMSSFPRVYQFGVGGLLAVLLFWMNFGGDEDGVVLAPHQEGGFENRELHRKVLSWDMLAFMSVIFMILYFFLPLLLPSLSLHPSIAGGLMVVIVFALIFSIEASQNKESFTRKFLRFPVWKYLGKWSYSIYLWHFPFIVIGDEMKLLPMLYSGMASSAVLRVCAILLASVGLGLVSYYVVERNFMKMPSKTQIQKIALTFMGISLPVVTAFCVSIFVFPNFDQTLTGETMSVADARIKANYSFPVNSTSTDGSDVSVFYGKRLVLFGDSMGVRSEKQFQAYERNLDVEVRYMTYHRVPSLYFPHWFKNDYYAKIGGQFQDSFDKYYMGLPGTLEDFEPEIVFIFNMMILYECMTPNLLCEQNGKNLFRYDGGIDGENLDYDKWAQKVYEGYKNFLEVKIDPTGAKQIVHILPSPEGFNMFDGGLGDKYDLGGGVSDEELMEQAGYFGPVFANQCLRDEGRNGNCDKSLFHRKSYFHVRPVLERVAEERNGGLKVISLDDFICPNGVCPARYKGISVWYDRIHNTPDYWLTRANDFLDLLAKNNVFIGVYEK